MNKNTKLIVTIIAFALVLLVAVFGYKALSRNNSPADVAKDDVNSKASDQAAEPDDSEEEKLVAPDFIVYDIDGKEVKLSDQRGKPVVVNFWASWCGPCRSELGDFDEAAAEYGDDVVFMMVNLTDGSRDTVEGVKDFVEKEGYSFPLYFDTEYSASKAYGVRSIPSTVFVDAEGNFVAGYTGAMSKSTLEEYIDAMIGSGN
ncbi:MAG: TlpA family protein disulfide reductase [Clostridiales bacterium]|nr:TlpA family protein disulfide reductase [Clostridiales bacterium]